MPSRLHPTTASGFGLALILAACASEEPRPRPVGTASEEAEIVRPAHTDWEDPRLSFDALDTNHDGEIDHAELEQVFDVLDTNQDGRIEADEDAELVIEADLNKDGVVERAEFEQLDLTRLGADLNGDGRISREEYDIYRNDSMLGLNTGPGGNRPQIDPASRFSIFRF